jgi:deoxyribodipyrimidine photo-lyase
MTTSYLKQSLDNKRVINFKERKQSGPVLYWMNRDQRANDNHALSFAQALALREKQTLLVYFGLDLSLNKYNERQLTFLIQGLESLETRLASYNLLFIMTIGDIIECLINTIKKYKIATVVTDFSPLKADRGSIAALANKCSVCIYQVDAHNIVPCWITSDKPEYAAYTIRPKINKSLDKYSQKAPNLVEHPFLGKFNKAKIDWKNIKRNLKLNDKIIPSGETAAYDRLEYFIKKKINKYSDFRNDPTKDYQSNLSAYLNFGQISTRTVMERVLSENLSFDRIEQFIDELVIRKELSDNFCYYKVNYDLFTGFPEWSQKSLNKHLSDPREYLYNLEQFESAETHDPLWNAAQIEMVQTGKMHGFMRMYWAKKILEWTPSPQISLEYAIYLNDKYQLDGNDPNGYAGIAWSIGGVHDRAWFEREIYGKVRYMNYNGCKRKFDVQQYISKYS